MPISTAPITARGMSRCGLRASPPICTACSKPCSANTTPSGSAAKTPCAPNGAKPPPAVKLLPWKETAISTTIVSSGTAVFQITVALLDSASQFTPARLMSVKTSMSTTATTRPLADQRAVLVDHAGPDVVEVGQRRLDLDRRDRDGLQPRHPARGEAREGAEREAREPGGAARERVGRAQLGVHERQQDDDHACQHPGDQRRPARRLRGGERAEQPARADDRAERDEHQRRQADAAVQMPRLRSRFRQSVTKHLRSGPVGPIRPCCARWPTPAIG